MGEILGDKDSGRLEHVSGETDKRSCLLGARKLTGGDGIKRDCTDKTDRLLEVQTKDSIMSPADCRKVNAIFRNRGRADSEVK